jgi:hypothetical protein
MNKVTLTSALAVCALFSCGPGAKISSTKQGAAEALLAASLPTSAKASQMTNPADTLNISFSCPEGGTAELSGFQLADIKIGTGGVNVAQQFTTTYKACGLAKSDVGVAIYNGALTVVQSLVTTSGSVAVNQKFTGKVLVQGAFDDFIDADVTQSVNVTALGNKSGAVAMTLKGTVGTSSGSFTFDEAVNVTAGKLSVQISDKK